MHLKNKIRLASVPLLLALLAMMAVWSAGRPDQAAAQPPTPNITIAGPVGSIAVGSNFTVTFSIDSGAQTIGGGGYELRFPAGVSFISATNLQAAHFPIAIGFPGLVTPGPAIVPTAAFHGIGVADDLHTPSQAVVDYTMRCDAAGTWNLDIEDINEDPASGSVLFALGAPIVTNYTPDGTVTVDCVEFTDIRVTKSDPTDPIATQQTFTYTIKATNTSGATTAQGLVVADVLPDKADGDGRGHKVFVGAEVWLDIDGDTSPDIGPAPCVPGFVGPYVNPFPPPPIFNSTVICSTPLLGPPFHPLPPGQSIIVLMTVSVPAAEAGKKNFDIAQGVLSNDPLLGVPNPTTDPNPTNEVDCVADANGDTTPETPLPPANAGCEWTGIQPANVSISKSGAPDPVSGGGNITWTTDIDVGAGSAASNPWGEGGATNDVNNCFNNLDDDGDTLVDFDGDPTGFNTAPDPDCAEMGPVITSDVSEPDQVAIVSATIDSDGDTAPGPDTCLETGTTDALFDLAVDVAPWKAGDQDVICSLANKIPANTANAKLVVVTSVDPALPASTTCTNESQIIWADPASASVTAGVACLPPVIEEGIDKGSGVLPLTGQDPQLYAILVGQTARVTVWEQIEVVVPGPNPNIIHDWVVGAPGGNVTFDWVELPGDSLGDLNGPGATFDPFAEAINFQTGPHTTGLTLITRDLDIKCLASQTTAVTANVSITSKAGDSPTSFRVMCLPEPREEKDPDQANLWIMKHPNCVDDDGDSKVDEDPKDGVDNDGDGLIDEDFGPCNPYEGKGSLVINEKASAIHDVDSPNDPDSVPEGLGAYEKQIKFDHKLVTLKFDPAALIFDLDGDTAMDHSLLGYTGRAVNCNLTIVTENWVMIGCVSVGSQNGVNSWSGPWTLSRIWVSPAADLVERIRPTKDNGVVTPLLDENCEWADIYGDPMAGMIGGGLVPVCGDATITIRMLEGDLNLDCRVDVLDEQAIAFRYGASFGLLLYDQWYDLEPKLADFDIDIKDLQFVFGRDGSICQAPIPPQPPSPPIP